ncbi:MULTISPECIES: hypothetical protein [Pseudanabaena]|uniref:Uncharacterized protein n=1 Tax=Pseudanabaena catenata USMAC16 TaxID=1855837 RepID=A0A9X4RHF8_9CYAN|nr:MULTISPECIES: hypothetical protein [Pseudanabaena]MDG3493965.1 hypothetical protein [Pseudanabaena catenata USMAC16]
MPLISSKSDRLKYPYFHKQAIAPQQTNNIKHRSPKISTLSPHKRSPLA